MNLVEMLCSKLTDLAYDNLPYSVHINCTMSTELKCPDSVREQFPDRVAFALNPSIAEDLFYDWDKHILSFYVRFNTVEHKIEIPSKNIVSFSNDKDGELAIFQRPVQETKEPTESTELKTSKKRIIDESRPKIINLFKDK